jgi:hypothetical protein
MFVSDNTIHVVQNKKPDASDPLTKYSASIRLTGYVDERRVTNPRKIGVGADMVSGLSGHDILLDQTVSQLVGQTFQTHLDELGYQIVESDTALFELSGSIKEFSYDVKARDEVQIVVVSTLKETASGKVLWSAQVKEKADRFAGVSGNNRKDVADYLKHELGVVVHKTTEAINTSLMASRPELFNLSQGAKPISGVTVFVAPNVAAVPIPASSNSAIAVTRTSDKPMASDNGLLLVTTVPARAKVYVDGVYYGLSPIRAEMTPGVRSVSAKSEGYRPATERVSIRKGDSTELELVLEH